MNIKQAAEQSGVSSQNIRFYETEGLVVPARRGNGYRDYSAKDVHDLKLIRMLRMLEMPLPQIRQVLQGELALPNAAQTQRVLLEQRAQQLAGAIQFCSQLQKNSQSLAALDVDQCLARMQTPGRQGGFLPAGWKIGRQWLWPNTKRLFPLFRILLYRTRRSLLRRWKHMRRKMA